MLGAVFHQELLLAGRRQRAHFLRWIYAAVLLAQLMPALVDAFLHRRHAAYAEFFDQFLTQHFALLFLLTPALTAGAITDEKTRGTLASLLTAHLRPIDVVLGKLLGRSYQILVLALVGLPIVAFFGELGDLHNSLPLAVFIVSTVLIVGLAALSILLSVWCRQTRDSILCTYLVILA